MVERDNLQEGTYMSDNSRTFRSWQVLLAIPMLTVLTGSLLQTPSGRATPAPTSSPESSAQAAAGQRPKPLLPDMTPLRAADLSLQRTRGERKVRFDSRLANIGRGPMEVRPNNFKNCRKGERHASQVIYHDNDDNKFFNRRVDKDVSRRSAGCMVFHPAHNHWHFEAAARYTLSRPDSQRNILVRARKMSFCLRDTERVPESFGTFNQPLYYGECGRNTPQGISRGWLDLYSSDLVGQALKLPARVRTGVLCLTIEVDPRNELRESNESNQHSVRSFRLHRSSVSPTKGQPCST